MITGKEFNELYKNKKFVKLTNEESTHNSFKFEEGLNTDTYTLNSVVYPFGFRTGLRFFDYEQFGKWTFCGNVKMEFMWDVEILDDSNVIVMNNHARCDKFILSNKRSMWNNEELCIDSIKQCGMNFKYVINKTNALCLMAIESDGRVLEHIDNQSEAMCLAAVNQNANTLPYVTNQTDAICLKAVKQNGVTLYYVKNQTHEICLEAVKQYGASLDYVINQTDEICLEAVKQNGMALKYVIDQTDEICSEAIKYNINIVNYIKDENRLERVMATRKYIPRC